LSRIGSVRAHVLVLVVVATTTSLTACAGGAEPSASPAPATVTVTETVQAEPTAGTEDANATGTPSEPTLTPTDPAAESGSGETLGPWTAPSTPGVSVVASGYQVERSFGWGADYGAVLYNNGPSVSVDVVVQGIHQGQVVSTDEESFTHVPAYSFFVLGSRIIDLKGRSDTLEFMVNENGSGGRAIDVDLSVKATVPSGRNYQNVPVEITNSGTRTMQKDSAIFVILADDEGHILGGSDNFTSVPVPGGQTVRDVVSDVEMRPGTTQIFAYVDLLNADAMFN